MAIQTRHKINSNFSSASMSDLIFLLLIFFILLSTLVSPNAIKLLLPNSNSKTMAKQNYTIYINAENLLFLEQTMLSVEDLPQAIQTITQEDPNATFVLRADKTVVLQKVVDVLDAVQQVNEKMDSKIKVILATSPK